MSVLGEFGVGAPQGSGAVWNVVVRDIYIYMLTKKTV